MEKQSYYCPAPWHGGYFTQQGCAVCCMYPVEDISPAELLTSPKTQAIKQGLISGDLDPACAKCIEKEQHGFGSMRITHIDHAKEFDTIHDYNVDSEILPQVIEVRFTNVCNFKCRMCYPGLSNLIANEINDYPDVINWYPKDATYGLVESGADTKFFNEIVSISKSLKRVYLTGGEPSVSKAVTDYMKTIVDADYAKNIEVAFSTNAGAINPAFVNHLPKFKKCQILLSLDAVGAIAEYQRHGGSWDRVAKNVQYYQTLAASDPEKYRVGIHAVITAYSVLGIGEFFEYLYANQLSGMMTICYSDFYKVQALIGPAREAAIKSVTHAIDVAGRWHETHHLVPVLSSLLTFLKDAPESESDWAFFCDRTRAYDQVRNENFEEVFGFSLNLPG
jgi:hypothetical protein